MRIKGQVKSELLRQSDVIYARMDWLEDADRQLLGIFMNTNATYKQMATLAGVNEATIARRVARIAKRLLDSNYPNIIRNAHHFTPLQMQIARGYYIEGKSENHIAEEMQCSRYFVRKTLGQISEVRND